MCGRQYSRASVPVGLIDMITGEPRFVLDVGCYCGTTGKFIKERWPSTIVVGIEPLTEAANLAAAHIDRVINSTFEAVKLEENGILPATFDVIIFADVLEHMYNPWAALQAAQAGNAPILIRIETKAGHGAGKPTSKIIEEIADRWAFLVKVLDTKTSKDASQ